MTITNLQGVSSKEQYFNFRFFKKGGMGEIYKAFDSVNSVDVAVKFIPINGTSEEELLHREIKASLDLMAKNIVKTHFAEKVKIEDTEYFYIVQDFYHKGNMRSVIQKNIPLDSCFKMMLDILNGLKTVHTKIVHRDLKPENILIDNDDSLLITDFGLAKFIGEKTKTKSFKGAGTIPYMAPECWLGDENTVQMDIYSLGIIFYEILTGEFPFNGKTENDWRDAHLYEQLPDIAKARVDTPVKIKQIISKMTQKRAKDRYQNIDEIIASIQDSAKQNKESNKDIERLASLGHAKSEQQKSEQLKIQQEKEKIEEYKKFIHYHITELSNELKTIIESINAHLEENKIFFKDNHNATLEQRTIEVSQGGHAAYFKFTSYDTLEIYEKNRIEESHQFQRERHGFVISQVGKSVFKQRNIIYIGKVETNFRNPQLQECFGFNLLLVKNENDVYGKWHIAQFSDSGISRSNRKDFALDFTYFLKDFELSFMMHTLSVNYRELQDKDLHRVIEEILQHK